MLVDRREMIDPFFEVRIGPPGATQDQLVLLTPRIHGFIESFEYSEMVDGGRGSASRITLNFLEDNNKPGSVLDLAFDKKGNIKFVDAATIRNGKARDTEIKELEQQEANIDENTAETLKKSISKKLEALRKAKFEDVPNFILQERNTVQVTWGYRSQKANEKLASRTVRGEILQINHRAGENDIPTTEVMAVDLGSGELHKIYPSTGITFTVGKIKRRLGSKALGTTIKDKQGNTINRSDDSPARIDDIIKVLATKSFLKRAKARVLLTKEELQLDLQDNTSGRTWPLGMSMHAFISQLTEKLFAHYYTTYENNVLVINIISRRIFEKNAKFHFLWKSGIGATGSQDFKQDSTVYNTILSYQLSLYPEGGSGASSTGINTETKKVVGSLATTSIEFSTRFTPSEVEVKEIPSQKMNDTDPDLGVVDDDNLTAGVTVYKESSGDSDHVSTADQLAGRMERGLRLQFRTIGIPQLTPATIQMSNIGSRYSGLYYLLSVTHRITNSDGYVCECVGESNAIATGGTTVKGPPVRLNLISKTTGQFRADPGANPVDFESTIRDLKEKTEGE